MVSMPYNNGIQHFLFPYPPNVISLQLYPQNCWPLFKPRRMLQPQGHNVDGRIRLVEKSNDPIRIKGLFSTPSIPALGAHAASCSMGTGVSFPGGKAIET
jgi:hypothetical protein